MWDESHKEEKRINASFLMRHQTYIILFVAILYHLANEINIRSSFVYCYIVDFIEIIIKNFFFLGFMHFWKIHPKFPKRGVEKFSGHFTGDRPPRGPKVERTPHRIYVH